MHEFHTQTQIYESNVLCTQIFKTTHTPGVGGGETRCGLDLALLRAFQTHVILHLIKIY